MKRSPVRRYNVKCELHISRLEKGEFKDVRSETVSVAVRAYNAQDALVQGKLEMRKLACRYGMKWDEKRHRHLPLGEPHYPSWIVEPAK